MLTAAEQLLLEFVNRARLDPLGEAARYEIDLNQGLSPGTLGPEARQVLAPDPILARAAGDYSAELIAEGRFSHTGSDGRRPWDRMEDAGYDWNRAGENISVRYTSWGTIDGDDAIFSHHSGLFRSSGHRENILNDGFREIGVGQALGNWSYQGGNYHASMVTQKFGTSGSERFVTGVAYDDNDGDGFYSLGEGVGGVRFDVVQSGAATTYAAGGYSVAVPQGSGALTVQITGSGANARVVLDTDGKNAKLDLVGNDTVLSSADLTLVSGVETGILLGSADLDLAGSGAHERLEGNKGANAISGGAGHDTMFGGAGADTLSGEAGRDRIKGEGGNDSLAGGDWADRLWGQNGRDTLEGGAGNDRLFGGQGADSLSGGNGADTLSGQKGNDTLEGGAGNDRFVFSSQIGADLVVDFTRGSDVIVMRAGNDEASNVSQFLAATTQVGANAVYDFLDDGRDTITFVGVTASSLSASDFDFG